MVVTTLAMVMSLYTHIHTQTRVQRSNVSKDRVETNDGLYQLTANAVGN